ncbi:uncharacterized protein LOC123515008 [Portunus trituberculatus]|uniref:uncharacterized protein LOC123515008 n=1 Tax=Portunus trituberculatus TaxID=210409 RepID=UPI001E1D15C9|nr:uncharacterized protein LOC123515008 [Portunus trituberculatus]
MKLHNLYKIRGCLNEFAAKAIVQAVVVSRLDYCNSLLYGATARDINCLQKFQNSAARFVSGASRYDHITPVRKRLHWLPIMQRVEYKVALIVYKALNNAAPSYISELLSTYVPCRQLRTVDLGLLQVPYTASCMGDRAFAVAGPKTIQ